LSKVNNIYKKSKNNQWTRDEEHMWLKEALSGFHFWQQLPLSKLDKGIHFTTFFWKYFSKQGNPLVGEMCVQQQN
jgi:hypothetical protein